MMMNRIDKELKDLDCKKVNFKSGNWSWGRGGHPFDNDEYFISFTDDKTLDETRYKLPACISQMLRSNYEHGAEDARAKIRAALDI